MFESINVSVITLIYSVVNSFDYFYLISSPNLLHLCDIFGQCKKVNIFTIFYSTASPHACTVVHLINIVNRNKVPRKAKCTGFIIFAAISKVFGQKGVCIDHE